ncbi:phytanoyl-CoA dioxygenase family protein [Ottowia testudinis]|uniref:Phytanoyl-CoA dioxygenase family protein n=1 Tax=Ottowia testudinis TaxID=2816950 RepID=A0A975H3W4_9BURK|nr:phytanoyl-CoA dioxygenase family protein [Ottowia testudinis]QTD45720.1 phytanoyl-CoA dioxygenase family protein [Ottowia testudinis]
MHTNPAPTTTASADARQRAERAATPELIERYARDGAVCMPGLLNADELALLRQGIDANIAQPSAGAKVASLPDDPGRFFEDFCNWPRIEPFRRVIHESPLAAVGARLMQSRQVRLYHDHVLVKSAGTRQKTPWHQDQPYYNIEGRQNVSFWIAVDPVPRESTLEFIAGSHRGPWLMPRSFMDHQAKWFPEGSLQDLPDIEAARDQFPILGWAVQPGDVVAFQMLSLHAAGGFAGPGQRRVFSLRLIGDDTTHAPRAWVTSPPFPGLDTELAAGAPMAHARFPLLPV